MENKENAFGKRTNNLQRFLCIFVFILILFISSIVFAADPPEIGSGSAILMDANTGKIIYEKNSEQKMYPASTTKIMTAIIVLENCDDLSSITIASENAIMSVPSRICHNSFHNR